jgi:hypothetical protein
MCGKKPRHCDALLQKSPSPARAERPMPANALNAMSAADTSAVLVKALIMMPSF